MTDVLHRWKEAVDDYAREETCREEQKGEGKKQRGKNRKQMSKEWIGEEDRKNIQETRLLLSELND